jgi:hypothetical protein
MPKGGRRQRVTVSLADMTFPDLRTDWPMWRGGTVFPARRSRPPGRMLAEAATGILNVSTA